MIRNNAFIFFLALLGFLLLEDTSAFPFEFPATEESTAIGQNYGYPSGTPDKGKTEKGNLDFVFETTFFAKNLELVSLKNVQTHGRDLPLDGETFIGYLAPIRVRYRPYELLTIEAGVILGRNFGDDRKVDEADPLFRLVHEPVKDFFLVAGNIIKTHAIHDALYDDVLAFRRPSEQGFQLRADLSGFKQDLWINWKVRETPVRSEEFEIGNVTQLRIGGLRADGQLLWSHIGGQKNVGGTVAHNLTSLFGGSYGADPGDIISFLKAFKDVRLGGYYLFSTDRHPVDPFIGNVTGTGFAGRLTMDIEPSRNVKLFIFGEYFKGNGLVCKEGDPTYGVEKRHEVGASVLFNLPAGLRLEVGFVGLFLQGRFVHTENLYISWGKGFPLLKNI